MPVSKSARVIASVPKTMEPAIYIVVGISDQVFNQSVIVVVIWFSICIKSKFSIFLAVWLIQFSIFWSVVVCWVHFTACMIGNKIDYQFNAVFMKSIPQILELIKSTKMLVCCKIITYMISMKAGPSVVTPVILIINYRCISIFIGRGNPNSGYAHPFQIRNFLNNAIPIPTLI